jgi:NAD(P)-dependent dehydrogenase (short-subunit alcohol dehydrogenase family)
MTRFLDQMFSLQGRTALVTGGSSGIGLAMAEALGLSGASVVLLARDAARLLAAGERLSGQGINVATVAADLAEADEVDRAAELSVRLAGEPDILLCAAGVNPRPPLNDLSRDEYDVTMAVNVRAPFLLGQRFGPGMAARGFGRIINIGSQQTMRAFGNSGAYGISKAAVCALTRSQAEAWSAAGVCCNAIAPGFVRTPLTEPVFNMEGRAEMLAARTMAGRNGTPEDFAGIAVFLAGPSSAYLSGQTIFVDGGFSVT